MVRSMSENPDICSAETLFQDNLTSAERCTLVTEHCETSSLIDFQNFYFCHLDGNDVLFYPVGVSFC